MNRLPAFIIFLVLTFSRCAFGQSYDTIFTDSDWEEFYREGYYDYNTYQLLREMVEGREIADSLEYAVSTLGASQSEIELNSGYPSATERPVVRSPFLPDRVKIGRKVHNSKNSGYLTLREYRAPGLLELKIRDNEDGWRFESRSVTFSRKDYSLTVGNYTMKVGCGLGIGRFDYRPVAFEKETDDLADLVFPDNSYYNGLNFQYKKMTFIYSSKNYASTRKNVIGGNFIRDFGVLTAGISALTTMLSSGGNSTRLGAGSIFIEDPAGAWTAEAGYGESGPGFCARFKDDDSVIKIWGYDDDFVNLQSSGYAYPDYSSYDIDISEVSFRQAQRGETGIYFNRKVTLVGTEFMGISQIWKKSPLHNLAMEYTTIARKRVGSKIRTDAAFSKRKGTAGERALFDLGGTYKGRREFGIKSYFWFEYGKMHAEKSRYYIFLAAPISDYITIRGRFRWNFVGDFDYFIEQKSVISEELVLTATYRWSDDYRTDLGPLYITLDKKW